MQTDDERPHETKVWASVDKELSIILNSVYTNVAKSLKTCLEASVGYHTDTIHTIQYNTIQYIHTYVCTHTVLGHSRGLTHEPHMSKTDSISDPCMWQHPRKTALH